MKIINCLINSIKKPLRKTDWHKNRLKRSEARRALALGEIVSEQNRLLSKLFGGKTEISVLNGPFKGMLYINTAYGSQLLPKIIGSYEEPIHQWIREISNNGYSSIIDVGCAEGYYAVGFKYLNKNSMVYGFDLNKSAINAASRLALLNKCEVHFEENCSHSTLNKLAGNGTLLFCDIEGAELELLNPSKAPSLISTDILVEAHDCFVENLSDILIDRFCTTHSIKIAIDYPFRANSYELPATNILSDGEISDLQNEMRPQKMSWIFMKAKMQCTK